MATLIPALGSCLSKMTSGEKRFANRLEDKLEDDYLLWYDVPIGRSGVHPDFIVLHPMRGILILEVKDWRLDTIQSMDKVSATLLTQKGIKSVANPLEQARHYAHTVCHLLERDAQLLQAEGGKYAGKLAFPWSYGVVFPNITRQQFESTDLGQVLLEHRVICKDEMLEHTDAEFFQERLWGMFEYTFNQRLSLPQIDRVRWHLFPQVRIQESVQKDIFTDSIDQDDPLPDVIKVMDLQQEQLARSLGHGHRVIHGVAGSGKTMILVYRCLHLAKILKKPILVLCYNKTLATALNNMIIASSVNDKVVVYNFHAWCYQQLKTYHVMFPKQGYGFYDRLVQTFISAVDNNQIPNQQYGAVLIDEGHDFKPEWLKLIVQMVDAQTENFLLLYDDAQSIYERRHKVKFSFKRLGIQAVGRTTILKLNYRNTHEILKVAQQFAREVLIDESSEDDGVPLISPESANRRGPMPVLMKLPTFDKELNYLMYILRKQHQAGIRWDDIAILYRNKYRGEQIIKKLRQEKIPVTWLNTQKNHHDEENKNTRSSVKVVTLHSSKGLEFPTVLIPAFGEKFGKEFDNIQELRLLYVGMTRAVDNLIITHHTETDFAARLQFALQEANNDRQELIQAV